jgi:hypothetical protein
MENLKTPILGAVLTQVPKGSGEDYGYYTQAYSYYSGRHKDGSDGGKDRETNRSSDSPESIDLK